MREVIVEQATGKVVTDNVDPDYYIQDRKQIMKHAMIGNVSVALKENNDGTYEVLVDCGGEEVSISVMAVPGSEEV